MTTRTATKPADDEVYDFNLNAVEAETELRPFRFLWATKDDPNHRFTMVHLEELDVWELLARAEGGEIAATLGIFQAALGKEEFAEFRKVPMPQYKMAALFKAYRKHCGQDVGESGASSDS